MRPLSAPLPKALSALALAAALAAAHARAPAQAPAPGQPPQAAEVVFVPPRDPPVPLLWKVSDEDNDVYLLGSFHLLRADDYPLSSDVNRAFADAESLVFELPPEEMNSPQLGLQMMQAALRSDGTRLDSELPPATAAKLDAWLAAGGAGVQATGLGAGRVQVFEPWFVGLMVSLTEMMKQGLDPQLGLEQHFIAAARIAGKPMSGFETGAEQIAFLDGMGRQEQLQFLDEALTEAQEGEAHLMTLHAAWRNGDAEAIWNEMAVDMQARYPQLYQRINVERNDAWLPKVEALLAAPGGEDALVIVGALHLLGGDGIVEKLRVRGFEVERICSACADSAQAPPATGEGGAAR